MLLTELDSVTCAKEDCRGPIRLQRFWKLRTKIDSTKPIDIVSYITKWQLLIITKFAVIDPSYVSLVQGFNVMKQRGVMFKAIL